MENSDFLLAAYGELEDSYGWTASFRSDPNKSDPGVWAGIGWYGTEKQQEILNSQGANNNFFCVSVLKSDSRKRNKTAFHRLAVLLADDADPANLMGRASYVFETSPGNCQIGIFLDPEDPQTYDRPLIDAVLQRMADSKLVNADASGNNIVRYGRLPVGTNTKAEAGGFAGNVVFCDLEYVYTLADAVAAFGIDLATVQLPKPRDDSAVAPDPLRGDALKLLLHPDPAQRSYHDPLMTISARLVAAGTKEGAVVNFLRDVGEAIKPPPGPEYDRWAARFGPELVRMVRGADKFAPETLPPPGSRLLTPRELKARAEDVEWLVEDLIPENSMGMIFGGSGTFKSFLAIDLAQHIVNEMNWTNRLTKPGSVVYLAAEGGAGISRRVEAWHHQFGLADMSDNFRTCIQPLLLNEADQIQGMADDIAALPDKPRLIIIDTLSQTFVGEENSSSEISHYLRLINSQIRARFEATVIIIHHTGHNVSDRPRGSSALIANLDFLLGVFREDKESLYAKVQVLKMKDAEKCGDLFFNMERVVIGQDKRGRELSSLVAKYHDSLATVRDALSGGKYKVIIAKLLHEGPATADEIRAACLSQAGGNEYTARKGCERALRDLQQSRYAQQMADGRWVKLI